MIVNPEYIELELLAEERLANPNFQGKWQAPLIRNPKYRYSPEWSNLYEDIVAVGLQFRHENQGVHFDNVLLENDD